MRACCKIDPSDIRAALIEAEALEVVPWGAASAAVGSVWNQEVVLAALHLEV